MRPGLGAASRAPAAQRREAGLNRPDLAGAILEDPVKAPSLPSGCDQTGRACPVCAASESPLAAVSQLRPWERKNGAQAGQAAATSGV
jgi:hypothetical protein